MKRIIATVILLSLVSVLLTGCIQWETSEKYELLQDIPNIKSIRVYQDNMDAFYEANGRLYNYSDPNEPCGDLIGEIPSDQYAAFTKELINLSFVEHHIIFLFPVTYDPNFYYSGPIVKIEYYDGSCELISRIIQYQFPINRKYPTSTDYSVENDDDWYRFLQNWVELPD